MHVHEAAANAAGQVAIACGKSAGISLSHLQSRCLAVYGAGAFHVRFKDIERLQSLEPASLEDYVRHVVRGAYKDVLPPGQLDANVDLCVTEAVKKCPVGARAGPYINWTSLSDLRKQGCELPDVMPAGIVVVVGEVSLGADDVSTGYCMVPDGEIAVDLTAVCHRTLMQKQRGTELLKQKLPHEAEEEYISALHLAMKCDLMLECECRCNLALLLLRRHEYKECVKHCDAVIEVGPRAGKPLSAKAHYRRAQARFELRDLQGALNDCLASAQHSDDAGITALEIRVRKELERNVGPKKAEPVAPPQDGEACSQPRFLIMMASHIAAMHRATLLASCLQSIVDQTHPFRLLISWSAASPELQSAASDVIRRAVAASSEKFGESTITVFYSARPLQQFEHYRLLFDLHDKAHERSGQHFSDKWILFSDDDDIWHPRRVAGFIDLLQWVYNSQHEGELNAVLVPWCVQRKEPHIDHPMCAADVGKMISDGTLSIQEELQPQVDGASLLGETSAPRGEYWQYAVRYSVAQEFFTRVANRSLLANQFCDCAFGSFVQHWNEGNICVHPGYSPACGNWMYYYRTKEAGGAGAQAHQGKVDNSVLPLSNSRRSEVLDCDRALAKHVYSQCVTGEGRAMRMVRGMEKDPEFTARLNGDVFPMSDEALRQLLRNKALEERPAAGCSDPDCTNPGCNFQRDMWDLLHAPDVTTLDEVTAMVANIRRTAELRVCWDFGRHWAKPEIGQEMWQVWEIGRAHV